MTGIGAFRVADRAETIAGIRTHIYMTNTAAPAVRNGYYGGMNMFLRNPARYTQETIDFVGGVFPGIPPSSGMGYAGAAAYAIHKTLREDSK